MAAKPHSTIRLILFFGVIMAVLVAVMKYIEYRVLVRDLATEWYVGAVAAVSTAIGIWIGIRLLNKPAESEVASAEIDPNKAEELGITEREYEVLGLMAEGCSNQEIADRLFISVPTVKSHSSKLFSKLDVQRRTQAVHRAKELRIIP